MLKLCRFLVTSCIVFTGSLFAYIHPCPGEWTVTGEFLYLKPSFGDTYFVMELPDSVGFPSGTRTNNDFDFKPGFRVGVGYGFCNCDWEILIDYARLDATQTRTVSGPFLAPTNRLSFGGDFQGYTGTARGELDMLYQRVDGIVGRRFWQCSGLDLFFKGGLEYAYLRLNEEDTYQLAPPDEVIVGHYDARYKTWGIGPQVGLEFNYLICDLARFCSGSLSFIGSASGSILAAQSKTNIFAFNEDGAVTFADVSDESTWRLIPAFHSRVGLNFTKCFSCFEAALELGYEFNTYISGVHRVFYPDGAAFSNSTNIFNNYDLQGLYVSLTLGY